MSSRCGKRKMPFACASRPEAQTDQLQCVFKLMAWAVTSPPDGSQTVSSFEQRSYCKCCRHGTCTPIMQSRAATTVTPRGTASAAQYLGEELGTPVTPASQHKQSDTRRACKSSALITCGPSDACCGSPAACVRVASHVIASRNSYSTELA